MSTPSSLRVSVGNTPDILGLHNTGAIDLYELAGFSTPCAFTTKPGWYRPRPQRVVLGRIDAKLSTELYRSDLENYISSGGTSGPHFRIYAIRPAKLRERLRTAEDKARRLGLLLSFDEKEIAVTRASYIRYSDTVQDDFLIQELGRADVRVDPLLAANELCNPVAVAVFGFSNREKRGQTSNPYGTTECAAYNLRARGTSGVSFIDDLPDQIRKYVLVHELGHYFGLCHVDGFSRIMVSGEKGQGSLITPGSFFGTLIHGGPRFTLEEGKQVWRFVLNRFPTDCLMRV